jgi:hypothetical protein
LVARYTAVNEQLEGVIRRERIVTLPNRAMGMRLASVAESAAEPAPHMVPPPWWATPISAACSCCRW